ncbi:MAG: PIG-L deacetylase family protein, partial [Promethearchaeota archaeon]
LTEKIVRIIRNYDPDLILTHRVNDYHRDHRYCGQLVMDANNMLIVPHYCPDTPISKTRKQPVICYLYDHFLKPYPFIPNILLDITDVFDQKAKALICHKSQMMEWLPWTQKLEHLIPKEFDDNIRKKMVEMIITMMFSHILIDYQELWNKGFPGRKIQYGEAFEISEYGRQPTLKELKTFFPGAYIPSKQDLKG